MQITIDDKFLDTWARAHGYVRLTDISAFARQHAGLRAEVTEWVERIPNAETVAAIAELSAGGGGIAFQDTFIDQVTKLENLDDLKPEPGVPSVKEITDALRLLVDTKGKERGLEVLARFGAKGLVTLPEHLRREFIAAAAEAVK